MLFNHALALQAFALDCLGLATLQQRTFCQIHLLAVIAIFKSDNYIEFGSPSQF